MAVSEKYVPLFFDWIEQTSALDAGDKGRLIDAIVRFARGDDGWQELLTGNERFVFPVFKAQMERAKAAREASASRSRENGRHGGRRQNNPLGSSETQDNPVGFSETQKNPVGFLETQNDNNNNNNNNNNEYDNDNEDDYEVPSFGEEEEEIKRTPHRRVARAVAREWRASFGTPANPATVRNVANWADFYGMTDPRFIAEAISAAALRNANDPVAYAIALFKDWKRRGIRDPDDLG